MHLERSYSKDGTIKFSHQTIFGKVEIAYIPRGTHNILCLPTHYYEI